MTDNMETIGFGAKPKKQPYFTDRSRPENAYLEGEDVGIILDFGFFMGGYLLKADWSYIYLLPLGSGGRGREIPRRLRNCSIDCIGRYQDMVQDPNQSEVVDGRARRRHNGGN